MFKILAFPETNELLRFFDGKTGEIGAIGVKSIPFAASSPPRIRSRENAPHDKVEIILRSCAGTN